MVLVHKCLSQVAVSGIFDARQSCLDLGFIIQELVYILRIMGPTVAQ